MSAETLCFALIIFDFLIGVGLKWKGDDGEKNRKKYKENSKTSFNSRHAKSVPLFEFFKNCYNIIIIIQV